jgi:glycerol kinase
MSGPILAIDQGTTNTKVLLVGDDGGIVQRASRAVQLSYPQAGWVEQDADALWTSVREAADECLVGARGVRPSGIAITNQRESAVVWERATGRPVGPVVVWQCRRTSERCERLRLDGVESDVRDRTGLPIDPLFSATKLAWLLDRIPDGHRRATDGALCAGTIDSWILWNLTGGATHRCDVSNASRTQLLNLRTVAWDDSLLDVFGVPAAMLPEIVPSSGVVGETAACGRIPAGVSIASMIGDSHAALFGQGGFRAGSVKATYGTGSSLMSATPQLVFSDHGLCSTIAWGIGREVVYALEGNISATGAALQWVAELLGLEDPAAAAELASRAESADGVFLVPAFVGLGAPYWAERARGLMTGITRGTTAAHLARAALESIAFQVHDVFAAMACDGQMDAAVLLADGGASRSDVLMQFQADVIGTPVVRNNATDISALGAAYLAGLALGAWGSLDEIESLPKSLERFEPRMGDAERRAAIGAWRDAVARCLFVPDESVTGR